MEDRRTFMAVALCVAVFILWYAVLEPALGLRPKQAPRRPQGKQEHAAAQAVSPQGVQVDPQKKVELPAYPDRGPVEFKTGRHKGSFTVRGGGLQYLDLLFPGKDGVVHLLGQLESGRPHFAVRVAGVDEKIEKVNWDLKEHGPDGTVEFSFLLPNGVEIFKKFTPDPSGYSMGVQIRLVNMNPPGGGQQDTDRQKVKLEIWAFGGIFPDGRYRHEQYTAGVTFRNKTVQLKTIGEVEKGEKKLADGDSKADEYFSVDGQDLEWIGLKNRFFAALLAPSSDPTRKSVEKCKFRSVSKEAKAKGDGLKNLNAVLCTNEMEVVAGSPVVLEFKAYLGPIQADALREAPPGASGILNYAAGCGTGCGPFGVLFLPVAAVVQLVAPVILAILKFLGEGIFGNYGVGIMATTLLIRLCLFPLSKKSQEAAFKMQMLAPQVELLRRRYGDDRQKFGVEQWKLFKEHKIHPAAGCLPMLIQLPIFVGMYSVFELSVELRGAPFMLWIRDLSQPDALVKFSRSIDVPLIPTFDSFNVLPIVMTITWFLQSWFAPRSPDPQMQTQQKIMMAMPVIFGIMCYVLASGLSLYFLVNSLLGMIEQKVIKRFFLKPLEGTSGP